MSTERAGGAAIDANPRGFSVPRVSGVNRQHKKSDRARALGPQYDGDLIVGGARDFLEEVHLFHFNLTGNRRKIGVYDPRLEDRVADNLDKWEITESESLLFGPSFGVVTDVQTGPNGNLFVVSLTHGRVYEIFLQR